MFQEELVKYLAQVLCKTLKFLHIYYFFFIQIDKKKLGIKLNQQ